MATQYTSLLGFAKPTTGELPGTWGTVINDSFTQLADDAIASTAEVDVTSGNVTLTTTASGSANEARRAIVRVIGTPGTTRQVIAPSQSKVYAVINKSNSSVVFKGSATTGVTVAPNVAVMLAWNGSDFETMGGDVTLTGTQTLTNKTLTSPTLTAPVLGTPASGTLTNCTGLPASGLTGQVLIANGGTGTNSLPNGILKGNATSAITAATGSEITTAISTNPVDRATNIAGGTARQIPFNTAANTTSFITAPSVSDTFLKWDGSSFTWAVAGGGGGMVYPGAGIPLSTGSAWSTSFNNSSNPISVSYGGTGATSLSGYVKGNGSSAFTASATIPSSDISGLGTMATQNSGNVSITGGNISGITLSGYGQLSGTNSWSGGNTFSSGVNLTSNTSVYAASSVQLNIDVNGSRSMTLFGSLTNFSNGHFAPQSDATYTCGTNIARWSAIWSTNATIQTSDQRLKTDITNSQLGLSFINKLRPVSYKWIVGGNAITGYVEEEIKDESGKVIRISKVPQLSPMPGVRTHYGLISQEVKAALDSENVGDFAGWVLSDKDEPTSTQNLRYGEFISPMIKAIQELSAKVNTLEAELAALKGN